MKGWFKMGTNNRERIYKKDVEQCVRKAIQQSHIPDENKIRVIVRDEIKKYYEKEELEQKKSFSEKFSGYFQNKKYKNIGWYILMFIFSMFDVVGFKILTESIRQIIDNYNTINVLNALVFILIVIVVLSLFITISIKIYDKMIEKDYKYAKIICFLEILFWCDIFLPSISSWIENLL